MNIVQTNSAQQSTSAHALFGGMAAASMVFTGGAISSPDWARFAPEAYVVEQSGSTNGAISAYFSFTGARVNIDVFQNGVSNYYTQLVKSQEFLGEEIERILDAYALDLYES